MRATLGCCAVAGWAEAEQAGRSAGELGRSEVRRWLAGREAVRWAERERGRRAGRVGAGRAEACWAAMCWACAGGDRRALRCHWRAGPLAGAGNASRGAARVRGRARGRWQVGKGDAFWALVVRGECVGRARGAKGG